MAKCRFFIVVVDGAGWAMVDGEKEGESVESLGGLDP